MCRGPSTSMVHEAELLFRKVGKFLFFLLWSSGTMPYICLELGFRGWLNWNLLHCQIAFCGLIVCTPYCLTGSSTFLCVLPQADRFNGTAFNPLSKTDFSGGKELSKISEIYLIFIHVNLNRYWLSSVFSLSNKSQKPLGYHERYMTCRNLDKERWAERNNTS